MSSEKTTRRDRVVMALGICALLLFAANLITMAKKHFFDKHESEHTVVVHRVERAPRTHVVVRPHIRHQVRIVTEDLARQAELVAMKHKLLEESSRLTREAAHLAEAGHADASMSLQQSVEQILARLQEVEVQMEQLQEMQFDVQVNADAIAEQAFEVQVSADALDNENVDVQVEVVDQGSN